MSKNVILTISIPEELRDNFKLATESQYTTMAQAARKMFADYVKEHLPEPPKKKQPRKRIKMPTTPPAEE